MPLCCGLGKTLVPRGFLAKLRAGRTLRRDGWVETMVRHWGQGLADKKKGDVMQFQEERQNMAAALRWAAKYDLHEGIDNHFSLEVGEDVYLINPWEVHWSEVTASDILVIDGDGKVLEGDHTIEVTAFYIHRAMHRMNPHAKAILHTHMPYMTALASTEGGRLEMVNNSTWNMG